MMMFKMKSILLASSLLLAGVVIVGCDRAKPTPAQPTPKPTADAATFPAALFLDKAPEGVQELLAAKKSAKVGDEIVLRGRVAGQKEPLAANRAIVTLLDSAVPPCEHSAM